MSGPQAEPAQAAPEPIADKRNRRWPWATLSVIWVVVLACAGVPIVWVVGPLVVGTVTADHGEGSPGAALLAFVFTFENGPDATGVERLIVAAIGDRQAAARLPSRDGRGCEGDRVVGDVRDRFADGGRPRRDARRPGERRRQLPRSVDPAR